MLHGTSVLLPFALMRCTLKTHRSSCQIGSITSDAPHIAVKLQAAQLVEPLR